MDRESLKDMWGALALRGMILILFGIAAVFWPGITLRTIVYLFGAFILVSGITNEIMGITNLGKAGNFWERILLIVLGLFEVGVGIYLLRHPSVSFSVLILLIGISFIVNALFQLFHGIFGEGTSSYRVINIIAGLLAGLAGVALLMQPAAGGVAFVWILGLYALITGPMILALAFDAKKAAREGEVAEEEEIVLATAAPRPARAK
jgi:uncharacterized membrane protein HdeD (DUF308 family)